VGVLMSWGNKWASSITLEAVSLFLEYCVKLKRDLNSLQFHFDKLCSTF